MIGSRYDGTGVYPPGCTPVTKWPEARNIVWKTPLPNMGNGSPICVGERVFVMCEPGWTHDAPLLVCVDARRLPHFRGNRIFIRSFAYLYCIGDPKAAFDSRK